MNNITTRLPSASTKTFLDQACFGLGATIAPFLSTPFVQKLPNRAYLFFLVTLGVALITAAVLVLVFEMRTEAQIVGGVSEVKVELSTQDISNQNSQSSSTERTREGAASSQGIEGTVQDEEKNAETVDAIAATATTIVPPAVAVLPATTEVSASTPRQGSGAKMLRIMRKPI